MLAAGLAGIENEYDVPDPVEENVFEMRAEERAERGIGSLPGSLWEAIRAAENSDLLRDALGEHVFDSLIRNKKLEWINMRLTSVIMR